MLPIAPESNYSTTKLNRFANNRCEILIWSQYSLISRYPKF